jgi:hypothetical protein
MREFINRLSESNEFFFENSFEEVAFKWNGKNYIAKQKKGKPYEIKGGETVLLEAILEGKEISKQEYESY